MEITKDLMKQFEQEQKEKLSASEAVYGFCSWLTTRDEKTVMSGSDDMAIIADRIKRFCEANYLQDPRDGWQNNLVRIDEA
jgi:hypothetical protein